MVGPRFSVNSLAETKFIFFRRVTIVLVNLAHSKAGAAIVNRAGVGEGAQQLDGIKL
jgi:hypothetical protein